MFASPRCCKQLEAVVDITATGSPQRSMSSLTSQKQRDRTSQCGPVPSCLTRAWCPSATFVIRYHRPSAQAHAAAPSCGPHPTTSHQMFLTKHLIDVRPSGGLWRSSGKRGHRIPAHPGATWIITRVIVRNFVARSRQFEEATFSPCSPSYALQPGAEPAASASYTQPGTANTPKVDQKQPHHPLPPPH